MNVRKEIDLSSAEQDKPILLWLLDKYHMESQWHFVAKCTHEQHGSKSYQTHRVWKPTTEGRLLYAHRNVKENIMEWISVDDSLPQVGVEVLAFRPDALLDYSDKPIRLCHLKQNGHWSGCHKVTHWAHVETPPGWTDDMERRQSQLPRPEGRGL